MLSNRSSALEEEPGLPMTHLAMAFAIAHPGETSAIIGPRTMKQLDDLLTSVDVTLTDEILDRPSSARSSAADPWTNASRSDRHGAGPVPVSAGDERQPAP